MSDKTFWQSVLENMRRDLPVAAFALVIGMGVLLWALHHE